MTGRAGFEEEILLPCNHFAVVIVAVVAKGGRPAGLWYLWPCLSAGNRRTNFMGFVWSFVKCKNPNQRRNGGVDLV
jgi:hypothetical protein